ncbi:MAG: hypothetical protein KAR07_07030, partial [Spirochaetes bacterium]|nr:hypothetical protein [Spirochaetota bacterium]
STRIVIVGWGIYARIEWWKNNILYEPNPNFLLLLFISAESIIKIFFTIKLHYKPIRLFN